MRLPSALPHEDLWGCCCSILNLLLIMLRITFIKFYLGPNRFVALGLLKGFVSQVEWLKSITPDRVCSVSVRFGAQVGFKELGCLIITAMRISMFRSCFNNRICYI